MAATVVVQAGCQNARLSNAVPSRNISLQRADMLHMDSLATTPPLGNSHETLLESCWIDFNEQLSMPGGTR